MRGLNLLLQGYFAYLWFVQLSFYSAFKTVGKNSKLIVRSLWALSISILINHFALVTFGLLELYYANQ